MCDCNRLKLHEQSIEHESSLYFDDCLWQTDNEIFAIKCEDCSYTVLSFARNCFTSVTGGCTYINKNVACSFCRQLISSLNLCVSKICLKPEDVHKDFKLEKIDK